MTGPLPLSHVKVEVVAGASPDGVEVVVDGDQHQPRPGVLHLCHKAPLTRLEVVTLHTRTVRVERLVVTTWGKESSQTHRQTRELKGGYHTESRCQYQPASFSSAFKLNGTACLVGVGVGGGGWGSERFPPQIWDM